MLADIHLQAVSHNNATRHCLQLTEEDMGWRGGAVRGGLLMKCVMSCHEHTTEDNDEQGGGDRVLKSNVYDSLPMASVPSTTLLLAKELFSFPF